MTVSVVVAAAAAMLPPPVPITMSPTTYAALLAAGRNCHVSRDASAARAEVPAATADSATFRSCGHDDVGGGGGGDEGTGGGDGSMGGG